MTIRAELSGSDTCSAAGITARANAPVLAMCRHLVAAGHDPATRLEAYRGDVLCLTVRTIGEGAQRTQGEELLHRQRLARARHRRREALAGVGFEKSDPRLAVHDLAFTCSTRSHATRTCFCVMMKMSSQRRK